MGGITLNLDELEQKWGRRSPVPPPSIEPPDYDAIARKYRGTAAEPQQDYDAIARKYGGTPGASDDERRTMLGFLGNVVKSTGSVIRGTFDPSIAVPGMTSLFAGMAEKSGFKPLPGNLSFDENAPVQGNTVDALIDHYKQRYGSWEGFTKALYEDPAGIALDASILLEPGAAGLRAAGLPRAAGIVGQVGRGMNAPLQAVRAARATVGLAPRAFPAIDTVAEATARRLRQSSLRGGYNINTPHEEVAGATAAMRGMPLTAEAVEQVTAEGNVLQQQKMKALAEAELRGATTPRNLLVEGLEEVRRKYQEQPLPGRDVKQVDRAIQEVLDTYPEQIPVTKAEAIKEGLVWKEGLPPELQAIAASEKNIAEKIRRDLVEWVPELEELNKNQQSRIWLKSFMETAINKRLNSGGFWERFIAQRNIVPSSLAGITAGLASGGLYGTVGGLGAAVTGALLSDPVIQAQLAVAINKAQARFPTRFGTPNMGAAVARAGKIAQDARIPIERRLPQPEQEVRYTPPPRDTSFVRGVPGEYARPEAIPPSRRLPAPDIITPPPAGFVPEPTSYVRPSGSWGASSRWTPPEEPPPTPPAAPPPVTPPPAPPSAAPPTAAAAPSPEVVRLTRKALKQIPNSPAQLRTRAELAAQQARFDAEKAANLERKAAATRPAEVAEMPPAVAEADFQTRKAKRTGKAKPEPATEAQPVSDEPQVGKHVDFVALGKKYTGKLEQIDDKGVAHINVDGKITKQDLAAVKPKGWQPPAPTPATTVEFGKERTMSGRKEFTARGTDSGEFVTIRGSHGGGYEVEREYYWTSPGESNRYGRTEKLLIGKPGYTKAEAKQVAEAYLKGEPHPLADIEAGLPMEQYKPGKGKATIPETGLFHSTIDGEPVWSDGHMLFKGEAPGKLSTSPRQPEMVKIWEDAETSAENVLRPVGFYRNGPLKLVVLADESGKSTVLNADYYDYANQRVKGAVFKAKDNKSAVSVWQPGKPDYPGGVIPLKMRGIVMPMRPDNLPPAIEALLKKK